MNKFLACKCADSWKGWALLILRVVVGITFALHGWQKVGAGNEAIAGFFGSIGIPAASFFAFVVTYLELLGGIALILGIVTHWASKLLAINMLVALFTVHMGKGFMVSTGGPELVLNLFAALVVIMVLGPGNWSLGGMKKTAPAQPTM